MVDVALLAFGGPRTVDEVAPFIARMTGRPPSDDVVRAARERYAAIGGGSPLPDITRRQAVALQAHLVQQLAFPVRVTPGFLYCEPTVTECLSACDGHEVVALPLSPFASRLTRDVYRQALDRAGGGDVPMLTGWHTSPGFVGAVVARIGQALDGADAGGCAILFTAHNVPSETVLEGDAYVEQLHQTIAQVVPQVMPGDWRLGFQSKGRRDGEWLSPEVEDAVRELAQAGWRDLLVVPVGFVSDHVETLYDLDVALRATVEDAGMTYRRSAAPNDSPGFIGALADVVIDYLARRPAGMQLHRPPGPHDHGG
jgi:ferrochelatase